MNPTIIGIVILVVVLIAGPFAALRAVSYYRTRRSAPTSSPSPSSTKEKDEENPEDKSSFW
jgi:uncharacterized membrane protein YdfJ with MMPL/SSD domain